MKIVHELIDPIIADAVAKHIKADLSKENVEETEKKTLLEEMVSSTDGMYYLSCICLWSVQKNKKKTYCSKNYVDPILLRDEIISLLVAGRDTVRRAEQTFFEPFGLTFYFIL